jgi:hypothetical protein
MSAPAVKIEWTDVSLDDVLRHFVKDFVFKDGSTLVEHQAFVDTAKNRVVFKLTTRPPTDT